MNSVLSYLIFHITVHYWIGLVAIYPVLLNLYVQNILSSPLLSSLLLSSLLFSSLLLSSLLFSSLLYKCQCLHLRLCLRLCDDGRLQKWGYQVYLHIHPSASKLTVYRTYQNMYYYFHFKKRFKQNHRTVLTCVIIMALQSLSLYHATDWLTDWLLDWLSGWITD